MFNHCYMLKPTLTVFLVSCIQIIHTVHAKPPRNPHKLTCILRNWDLSVQLLTSILVYTLQVNKTIPVNPLQKH